MRKQLETLIERAAVLVGGRVPADIGASIKLQTSDTLDPNSVTRISEPAANTEASATLAAPGSGLRWVVDAIYFNYTGAAPAITTRFTVESPSATFILRVPTLAVDVMQRVEGKIYGAVNAAVIIKLPAGGAGALGKFYVSARVVREVSA